MRVDNLTPTNAWEGITAKFWRTEQETNFLLPKYLYPSQSLIDAFVRCQVTQGAMLYTPLDGGPLMHAGAHVFTCYCRAAAEHWAVHSILHPHTPTPSPCPHPFFCLPCLPSYFSPGPLFHFFLIKSPFLIKISKYKEAINIMKEADGGIVPHCYCTKI